MSKKNPDPPAAVDRLEIVYRPIGELKPYAKNARTHPREQIELIKDLFRQYGWTNPILLDGESGMLTGHGRLLAAGELWDAGESIKRCPDGQVPTIDLHGLSDAEKRAYVIADNASAEKSGWDAGILTMEVGAVKMGGLDLRMTGLADSDVTAMLDTSPKLREVTEVLKPKRMMRVLVSVPVDSALAAREILEQLDTVPGIEVIYGAN